MVASVGLDLDLAGLHLRVHVACRARRPCPGCRCSTRAQLPGELVRLLGDVRLEDDLGEALAVAQVDEDRAAVVAAVLHPAEEHHLLADVGLR